MARSLGRVTSQTTPSSDAGPLSGVDLRSSASLEDILKERIRRPRLRRSDQEARLSVARTDHTLKRRRGYRKRQALRLMRQPQLPDLPGDEKSPLIQRRLRRTPPAETPEPDRLPTVA